MITFIKRNSSKRSIALFTLGPIIGVFLVYIICAPKLGVDGFVGVIFFLSLCLTCPFFVWAFFLSIIWQGDPWIKTLLIGISGILFLASLYPIFCVIALIIIGPINPG